MLTRSITLALVLFGFTRGAGAQQPNRASCSAAASLRSTGASVGVIDSAALAPFFQRTLSEALTARLPGVSVMASSGVAGAGSRVRLRGPSGIIISVTNHFSREDTPSRRSGFAAPTAKAATVAG